MTLASSWQGRESKISERTLIISQKNLKQSQMQPKTSDLDQFL